MGGIRSFVSKGWAAKDYTHLSSAGGREISKRLVQDLIESPIDQVTRQVAESSIEESLPPTKGKGAERIKAKSDTLKQRSSSPTTLPQESTAKKDSI